MKALIIKIIINDILKAKREPPMDHSLKMTIIPRCSAVAG